MQTLKKYLPLLASLVLLLALAAVFYWQLRDVLTPPSASQSQNNSKSPRVTEATPEKRHDIAKFSLFGKAGAAPEKQLVEEKELPKTNLKLTLTGVSAGSGNQIASALVEGPDRNTEVYKVGDTLPGNATLHNIYDDRIVIDRSGRLENLYFPKVSTGGAQYLAAITQAREEPRAEIQPAPTPSVSSPGLSEGRKQSIKDRLNAIRARIRSGQN
ncbi:MAG: hypothetical protein C9356_03605 [Oleiphilus sp.]|nr:MAG: hypothetical protein C9356_03605 [Oleiphilus sp.]